MNLISILTGASTLKKIVGKSVGDKRMSVDTLEHYKDMIEEREVSIEVSRKHALMTCKVTSYVQPMLYAVLIMGTALSLRGFLSLGEGYSVIELIYLIGSAISFYMFLFAILFKNTVNYYIAEGKILNIDRDIKTMKIDFIDRPSRFLFLRQLNGVDK